MKKTDLNNKAFEYNIFKGYLQKVSKMYGRLSGIYDQYGT